MLKEIEFKAICIKLPTDYCNRLNQIYDCYIGTDGYYYWKSDSAGYGFDHWSHDNFKKLFKEHFEVLPSYQHLFIQELEYEIC